MAVNIKQLKENGTGEVFYPQTTIEGLVNANGNSGIDDVPTSSSSKLVRSGGIATAISTALSTAESEIADAKSEVKSGLQELAVDASEFELGRINGSTGRDIGGYTDRLRSGYLDVCGVFRILLDDTLYRYSCYRYTENEVFIGRDDSLQRSGAVEYTHTGKIRIVIQKADGTDFTGEETDMDCRISVTLQKSIGDIYGTLHAADTNLTAQIDGITRRIDDMTYIEVTDWVQGWIGADGSEGASGTNGPLRIRSGFYKVEEGSVLVVKFAAVLDADTYQVMPVWYDASQGFLSRGSMVYSYEDEVPEGAGYVKFVLRRKSNTDLSPETYDGKMFTNAGNEDSSPVIEETDPQVTVETGIPLYWREEIERKTAVQRAIEAGLGEQSESFVFITDMHIDFNARHSAYLVGGVLRRANVGKVVFGGDVPAASAFPRFYKEKPTDADELASDNQVVVSNMKQELRDFQQLMKNVAANGGEYYPVHGNHDLLQRAQYNSSVNGAWQALSWDEISHIMFDRLPDGVVRQSASDHGSMYYYKDDYLSKTRTIVLDTFNNNDGISGCNSASSTEITWLEGVLGGVPQGWAVNIMTHGGLDAITNNGYSSNSALATALYGAVSTNGLDKVLSVNGHHHHDAVTYVGGVWQVAVMSDARYGDAVRRSPVHQLLGVAYANSTSRGSGNTTEHAFDIFNTDWTNGLISVVRVGTGNGGCRYIHTEPLSVNVGSSLTMTKGKVGDVTAWGCYDNAGNVEDTTQDEYWTFANEVGTVSDGVFTALSAGTSIVICADEEGNTEYWAVNVE